jgi:hypothetical protein
MTTITIEIKDNQKLTSLLDVLNSLQFVKLVEVKQEQKKIKKTLLKTKNEGLKSLKGLWKGKDISLEEIRKTA